jgi:hypothetical protein
MLLGNLVSLILNLIDVDANIDDLIHQLQRNIAWNSKVSEIETFSMWIRFNMTVFLNTIYSGPDLLSPANFLPVETSPDNAAHFQRTQRPQDHGSHKCLENHDLVSSPLLYLFSAIFHNKDFKSTLEQTGPLGLLYS